MEHGIVPSGLDTRSGAGLEPVGRAEVLPAMAGRRRTWPLEQKLAMVAQMERCGSVAAFARGHDVRSSLLYTWRRELRYALEASRPVEQEAGPGVIPLVADGPKRLSDDVAIEVEVAGAVVRIGRAAKPDLATVVLKVVGARSFYHLRVEPWAVVRPISVGVLFPRLEWGRAIRSKTAASSSRPTRAPEIDVSAIRRTHSRL